MISTVTVSPGLPRAASSWYSRVLVGVLIVACHMSALAEDWPMWRCDAARSGESAQVLPGDLALVWTREEGPLDAAFENPRLRFDAGHEPIVLGDSLFFASPRDESVTAVDVETGATRWRFFADGPVRLAPAGWRGRIYFGADDGFLYCVDARSGALHWRFRAAPSRRKVIGNRRLISLWPVRGGPAIHDGVVYFASGVWSFEGVFVWALDAESGEVVWLNDSAGFVYGSQPHNAEGFGGLTPQGYVVVSGDDVIVPSSAAYPAVFDRQTGELRSFELPRKSRLPGGWFAAGEKTLSRDLRRGKVKYDADVNSQRHEDNLRKGLGESGLRTKVMIGGMTHDFTKPIAGVEQRVHSVLAGAGRLFVVGADGDIHCLAKSPGVKPERRRATRRPLAVDSSPWTAIERALPRAKRPGGHALVLGVGDGDLLASLAISTEYSVVAIDPELDDVRALRERFHAAGLQGERVRILPERVAHTDLPPYFAELVVVSDEGLALFEDELAAIIERVLHPFGGVAVLPAGAEARDISGALGDVEGLVAREREDFLVIERPGALPGSANYLGGWNGEDDALVRAPLGVLWFDDRLGYFKRSPQPLIVDGVMTVREKRWDEGAKTPYRLRERVLSDIYTGREISESTARRWTSRLPDSGAADGQPNQYRPPWQKDAWNPKPPAPGFRVSPLTGKREPRSFPKSYGCDGGVPYGQVFTMRSGTAAFYDMSIESGTINVSGPRSGCTNSIIPAGGLLNLPYFYVGCTCSYPLPVGLAMHRMPDEHEQWASYGAGEATDIERVGVNFGAPGDRVADGTLWLEHPPRGGASPALDVSVSPETARPSYRHSLWIDGGRGWPWVAASSLEGVRRIRVAGLRPGRYILRLVFAELRAASVGRRFGVSVDGERVIESISPGESGVMRALVRELPLRTLDEAVEIELHAIEGEPAISGLEIVREGLELEAPRVLEPRRAAD